MTAGEIGQAGPGFICPDCHDDHQEPACGRFEQCNIQEYHHAELAAVRGQLEEARELLRFRISIDRFGLDAFDWRSGTEAFLAKTAPPAKGELK